MSDGAQLDLINIGPLVEQVERTMTFTELAGAVRHVHDRPNTNRSYAQDWARWTEFVGSVAATGHALDLYPDAPRRADRKKVQEEALLVFAAWLAKGGRTPRGTLVKPHAPESIRRRLTGVLNGWREHGLDYPRGVTAPARKFVKGYEDELIAVGKPTGRGQAPVLVVDGTDDDHISQIVQATWAATKAPKDPLPVLTAYRDIAVITMAVAIGARSEDIAGLDVGDITPGERGIFVHVRRSKTRTRKPAVPFGPRDGTCPVLSWRRWQEASGVAAGAAFRKINKHGQMQPGRLSPQACSDIVARAGQRAGIVLPDGKSFTIHSCRAGFATAAARAKKDPAEIAAQAGWGPNSPAMHGYIRQIKVWQTNVLDGIGL